MSQKYHNRNLWNARFSGHVPTMLAAMVAMSSLVRFVRPPQPTKTHEVSVSEISNLKSEINAEADLILDRLRASSPPSSLRGSSPEAAHA